jgi:23S rRNA C2498 (ribose-2'-O)-methylase RlmM
MKEINIKSLECDMASNVTKVTIDIVSVNGDFRRVLETLNFPLEGRFTSISDTLYEAIHEKLEANGIEI